MFNPLKVHPSKANLPIEVTELGMVRLPVKPPQPENAYQAISVTEFGITVFLQPVIK